ncbi:SpoVG family protein [candidate division KSB1 bacterium]
MEITDIVVNLRNEHKLKAFVDITFDDEFIIRGLKIINGQTGLFVCMPSRKLSNGQYKDIAHPVRNDFRVRMEEHILEAYRKELEKPRELREERDDEQY